MDEPRFRFGDIPRNLEAFAGSQNWKNVFRVPLRRTLRGYSGKLPPCQGGEKETKGNDKNTSKQLNKVYHKKNT